MMVSEKEKQPLLINGLGMLTSFTPLHLLKVYDARAKNK
jgi:hypothetical protein